MDTSAMVSVMVTLTVAVAMGGLLEARRRAWVVGPFAACVTGTLIGFVAFVVRVVAFHEDLPWHVGLSSAVWLGLLPFWAGGVASVWFVTRRRGKRQTTGRS
jgi:hypothetical protein